MKRTLPLLLLLAALSAVAITLLQPGQETEIEMATSVAITPESAPEEQSGLVGLESSELEDNSSEREAAPGIGGMSPAGENASSGRALKGRLVTPVGSPRDPSLRVVAVSLEGAL